MHRVGIFPKRRVRSSALRTSHSAPALAENQFSVRQFGIPEDIPEPLYLFRDDRTIKAHPSYRAAKSGDSEAAVKLVYDVAQPLLKRAVEELPKDVIYVAPHAREASGDNAIPQVIAALLSMEGGLLDTEIVQATKVYHTGADPMERLNRRARFVGRVLRGKKYVLVDDVTTLGGTLCDLSDHIQRFGGMVVGAIVLVNASRSGKLYPDQRTIKKLEGRYGDEVRKIFAIETHALTADEAQYLIGFRSAEEIRGRSAKAREETIVRLRSKGVLEPRQEVRRQLPFPGASALRSQIYAFCRGGVSQAA